MNIGQAANSVCDLLPVSYMFSPGQLQISPALAHLFLTVGHILFVLADRGTVLGNFRSAYSATTVLSQFTFVLLQLLAILCETLAR